jgi:hypothetical protein
MLLEPDGGWTNLAGRIYLMGGQIRLTRSPWHTSRTRCGTEHVRLGLTVTVLERDLGSDKSGTSNMS